MFIFLFNRYGRRLTYFISVAMLIIGRIISILAGNSYFIFVTGCLIAYIPSWSAPQTTTIISTEISSTNRRITVTTTKFKAGSLGLVLLGLLYWWLRDWKIVTIVTTAPLIFFLILSWSVP